MPDSRRNRQEQEPPNVSSSLLEELYRLYGGLPDGAESRNGDIFITTGSGLESLSLEELQQLALEEATGRSPAPQSRVTQLIERLRQASS